MAQVDEKENIADGLVASTSLKAPSLSPKKTAPKKKRAKSIGPGGLEKEEEAPLKESKGNRRKSAFVPAVKSILSSNAEDERKRHALGPGCDDCSGLKRIWATLSYAWESNIKDAA